MVRAPGDPDIYREKDEDLPQTAWGKLVFKWSGLATLAGGLGFSLAVWCSL